LAGVATSDDPFKNFGREVRRLRKGRGLTIEQLAERAELSTNYLGAVERGEKNPSLGTVVSIARGLDVAAGALLVTQMPGEGTEELSPRDFQMLASFRSLPDELKNIVIALASALVPYSRR
jgi:transcriptional regulator with XRE-family HTH domain